MTTIYNEYDDEEDTFDESTDVVKQLRKVNKTLDKRTKELEQELSSLRSQSRQRTVKDVLQSRGVNPKIASFIPSDIETSEEGINAWLDENSDIFGGTPSETEDTANQSPDISAQKRINNVVLTGQAPDISEDTMSKILSATNPAELSRILGL